MFMDRKNIGTLLQNMTDRRQLLDLLNTMKREQFGAKTFPITLEQLKYYGNVDNENRYHTFLIKKKTGGTREISAPAKGLQQIQLYLNEIFKAVYTPSPAANGFTDSRSVITGAAVHVGHNYVLNLDLSNFFPSIEKSRVWKRLTLPPFNFSSRIADVVAGLCCIKVSEKTDNGDNVKYVLPQGAPTSPLLTNAICDTLDRRLTGLARRFGLHYTRYADDMTFSSMHNVYQKDGEFLSELKRIIADQHFVLNEKKTRLQKRSMRQEVTGITVNDKLNVTHEYIRDLRSLLYIWRKYGYDVAFKNFYTYYKDKKGHIKKGEPIMENVVEGKLNYLKMVKGELDPVYMRLHKQYIELRPVIFEDNRTEKNDQFRFVSSIQISKFEEDFKTNIEIRGTEKKNFIGYCVIDKRDVWVRISKSLQKILHNLFPNAEPKQPIDYKSLKKTWITLCRHEGKNFWLLSEKELRRNEVYNLGNVAIPVDELLTIWEEKGLEEAATMFRRYATGEELSQDSSKGSIKPPIKKMSEDVVLINKGDEIIFNNPQLLDDEEHIIEDVPIDLSDLINSSIDI
jgi:RNA-directed DNA polymerase